MATTQEKLIEANRRGLLKGDRKAKFDEAVRRGLITIPGQPAPTPTAPAPQPQEQTFGSKAVDFAKEALDETFGAFEPALTFATGAIAEPIAGLAGLAAAPFTPDTGASVVEQTRDLLTFDPVTRRGQRTLGAAGELVQPIAEAAEEGIRTVTDPIAEVAGPGVATAVHTLPFAALEALGLRGLRTARGSKQVTGITDDVAEKLAEQDINIDDLSDADVSAIQQEVTKSAQERLQRFQEQGIPATQGDITQQSAQKGAEARVLEVPGAEGREGLARTRIEQSEGLRRNLESLRDQFAGDIVADDLTAAAGEAAKEVIAGEKSRLLSKKGQLYTEFAEQSSDISDIPLDTDQIRGALPDDDTLNRLARGDGAPAIKEVDDLLVEFGVIDTPELVQEYLKGKDRRGNPNKIKPLNVGNHDEFRQALNAIDAPRAKPYIIPIKNALDGEVDFVGEALEQAGFDEGRIAGLKEARKTVREIKTKFSPNAIAGKIINAKSDGFTPQVEVSKVFNEVASANKPIENLDRVMEIFDKAGDKGRRAKSLFQAKVVADVLDGAFSAKSRTIDGQQLVSRAGFDRAKNRIGDDKIKRIFRDNPDGILALNNIGKTLDDITPSGFEIPKGSGSVILDVIDKTVGLSQLGNINLIRGSLGTVKDIVERGAQARVIEDALSPDPSRSKLAIKRLDSVQAQLPNLYKVLGIAQLVPETRDEETNNGQ
jgi:hypothetical protein